MSEGRLTIYTLDDYEVEMGIQTIEVLHKMLRAK